MKRKLVGMMVIFGLLGVSTAPNAADQIVPGLACRYYGLLGDDVYFNPSGYSANGLKNVTTSNIYVACPVTKSQSKKTRGAWIVINDDSTTCALYRRKSDGTNEYKSPTSTTASGSWYLYQWDFGSAGWDTVGNSVSIYCRLDGGKVINHYYHQEL